MLNRVFDLSGVDPQNYFKLVNCAEGRACQFALLINQNSDNLFSNNYLYGFGYINNLPRQNKMGVLPLTNLQDCRNSQISHDLETGSKDSDFMFMQFDPGLDLSFVRGRIALLRDYISKGYLGEIVLEDYEASARKLRMVIDLVGDSLNSKTYNCLTVSLESEYEICPAVISTLKSVRAEEIPIKEQSLWGV